MADVVGDGFVGDFETSYKINEFSVVIFVEGVGVRRFGLIHHWVSVGHGVFFSLFFFFFFSLLLLLL